MRVYLLLRAPWWILALIYGIYFGAVTGVLNAVTNHQDFATAAAGGAAGGLFFGLLMGVTTSRRRDRLSQIAGPVSREQLPVVFRAAAKGPIPDDPDIRRASGQVIAYRLSRLGKLVVLSYAVFGAFSALALYLVMTSGRAWWLAFALFASFVPLTAFQAARTKRRAALFGVTVDDAPDVVDNGYADLGVHVDWGKVGRAILRNRYLFVLAAVAITGLAIFRIIAVGGEHGWGEVILAVVLWGITLWVFLVERVEDDD